MTGTESLDGEQKPRCRPMTDGEPRSTDQRKRGLKALIIFYLPPTVTASKERFLQIDFKGPTRSHPLLAMTTVSADGYRVGP